MQTPASGFLPLAGIETRAFHTQTRLADGTVLLAGGSGFSDFVEAAAVFDPATGDTREVGALLTPRQSHTGTLLGDGRVLIAGGVADAGRGLASTELYDPTVGTFTAGPSMALARVAHAAVRLADGRVLVAGGVNRDDPAAMTMEVYDAATASFAIAGALPPEFFQPELVALPDGRVLVVANRMGALIDPSSFEVRPLTSAGGLAVSGFAEEAPPWPGTPTLLLDGTVLLTGRCCDADGRALADAAIFDPERMTLTAVGPMTVGRSSHSATVVCGGRVLLAGGIVLSGHAVFEATDAAEVYDPATRMFERVGPLGAPRGSSQRATSLPDGNALIVGHFNFDPALAAAELFVAECTDGGGGLPAWEGDRATDADRRAPIERAPAPGVESPPDATDGTSGPTVDEGIASNSPPADQSATSMFRVVDGFVPRGLHSSTPLADGRVLIAGGLGLEEFVGAVAFFDPGGDAFAPGPAMLTPRSRHTGTLLSDGRVLLTGGEALATPALASTELYDPASEAFVPGPSMTVARVAHEAVRLPDGRVLVAFGVEPGAPAVRSLELYDPAADGFATLGELPEGMTAGSLTVLSDGQVLAVASGRAALIDSVSLVVTPLTATTGLVAEGFAEAEPRWPSTPTALPDGTVLLTGECCDESMRTSRAALFDPARRTLTAVGSMQAARAMHVAVAVCGGRVLVVGGAVDPELAHEDPASTPELYDPLTRTFEPAGPDGAIFGASIRASALPDGSVLIAGHFSSLPGFAPAVLITPDCR